MRFFNTAGPCNSDDHYMLAATTRLADEHVFKLIENKSYFVVHAPRQTGKTTTMRELARHLTASGYYIGILLPDISERTSTTTATTPAGRTVTVIRG